MKWTVDFADPANIEATRKTFVVALTDDEAHALLHFRGPGEELNLRAHALVLQHAYKLVPDGYLHDCDSFKMMLEH